MNKTNTPKRFTFQRIFERKKDLLVLLLLGCILIAVAYSVFHKKNGESGTDLADTQEEKVLRVLEEIDGVGEASVAVYEEDGAVKSVVVVCEGANDIRVVMNVREAVSAALGAEEKSIKIFLKK